MEPKILVSEEDIINTYSKAEQFSCQKYFEYQKLMQENPSFGYKKCAKFLSIKQGQVRWWHTKGAKRAIPLPLKVTQKLKEVGLLPFNENHKDAEIIFNILGTLFGDGGIDIRFNTVAFISSDKRDVDLWHSDLLRIFPFAQGKTQIVEGGEYGHSYNIRCYDRAVVRFFAALGAPVGSKIVTDYSLPKYFSELKGRSYRAFFDGLFSSEIAIPRFVKTKYITDYFKNFSLSLSKAEFLEQSHLAFMNAIKHYSKKIGIKCTAIVKKDKYRNEPRKDGHHTHGYRIFFRTNMGNALFFNKIFPLCYSAAKKEKLQKEVEFCIQHNPPT
ncbi:MAG: hypothetical protein AABW72_02455 [archaeon]